MNPESFTQTLSDNQRRASSKKKEDSRRTFPMLIMPEEVAVQFVTDFLTSTLSPAPTQEDDPTQSLSVVGTQDAYTLNSLERNAALPPTSRTGALLETTTAPPSSPTTEIVALYKILHSIYVYIFSFFS